MVTLREATPKHMNSLITEASCKNPLLLVNETQLTNNKIWYADYMLFIPPIITAQCTNTITSPTKYLQLITTNTKYSTRVKNYRKWIHSSDAETQ